MDQVDPHGTDDKLDQPADFNSGEIADRSSAGIKRVTKEEVLHMEASVSDNQMKTVVYDDAIVRAFIGVGVGRGRACWSA